MSEPRPRKLGQTVSLSKIFAHGGPPLIKQLGVVAALIVATVLTFVIPSAAITDGVLFSAGAAIAVAATVWAALSNGVRGRVGLDSMVPALDFVALAVMRTASGGSTSIVSSLAILPVVWFAMKSGRQNIAFASVGGLLVVIAPILATGVYLENPSELLRGLFVAVVYAMAAAVINEVSRQARQRFAYIKTRDRERGTELALGGAAQQALLPGNTVDFGAYTLAGVCLPAKGVGGDYYDWYGTPDGYSLTICDVMGKGAGAAIIAATARAVVRSARENPDPLVAVARADDCLANELSNMSPFATMFHARLSEHGQVRFVDAGHGLTLVVRSDGTSERIGSGNLPLGLGMDSDWASGVLQLERGDSLVSFSDGLLDLYGGDDSALARIAELLGQASSPAGQIDLLIASAASAHQDDDVTVVALRRE